MVVVCGGVSAGMVAGKGVVGWERCASSTQRSLVTGRLGSSVNDDE